ncbi:hypothetical protein T12_6133 [Trichinella patagoniensis]|uniref:Uncharacterized protein n=1 Tax=Trichinella patagoniensis TaxID=990121 RepID=A0A0V1AI85_9BILA|nr:hypothetical protein T12_6133 [Trichinella patagoniensis]
MFFEQQGKPKYYQTLFFGDFFTSYYLLVKLAELNMRATGTSRPYNINGARLLKRTCTNAKFSQSYNIVMKGVDLHDRLAAAYHLIPLYNMYNT